MGLPAGGEVPGQASPASPGDPLVPGPAGYGGQPPHLGAQGPVPGMQRPVPGVRPPAMGGERPAPGAGPGTGDPRVDEAVARLAELAGRPVAEHPEVFGYVHDRLAEALGDLETGGHSGAGDQPGRLAGPSR